MRKNVMFFLVLFTPFMQVVEAQTRFYKANEYAINDGDYSPTNILISVDFNKATGDPIEISINNRFDDVFHVLSIINSTDYLLAKIVKMKAKDKNGKMVTLGMVGNDNGTVFKIIYSDITYYYSCPKSTPTCNDIKIGCLNFIDEKGPEILELAFQNDLSNMQTQSDTVAYIYRTFSSIGDIGKLEKLEDFLKINCPETYEDYQTERIIRIVSLLINHYIK